MDPQYFAEVCEHPDVLPQVSLGHGLPDFEELIGNPLNICLMNEYGGFLFVKHAGADVYDVHTAFVPEGRGPHLVELALQARDIMFFHAHAVQLRTFVAYDNRPARMLALAAGFTDTEEIEVLGAKGKLMVMDRKDACQ
jgi:hypothetical protein